MDLRVKTPEEARALVASAQFKQVRVTGRTVGLGWALGGTIQQAYAALERRVASRGAGRLGSLSSCRV